jgi:hypothetical protein
LLPHRVGAALPSAVPNQFLGKSGQCATGALGDMALLATRNLQLADSIEPSRVQIPLSASPTAVVIILAVRSQDTGLTRRIGVRQRAVPNVAAEIPALRIEQILIDQRLIRTRKPPLPPVEVPGPEVIEANYHVIKHPRVEDIPTSARRTSPAV